MLLFVSHNLKYIFALGFMYKNILFLTLCVKLAIFLIVLRSAYIFNL